MNFNKNLNEFKIGIAISTYSTKRTEQKRFDIIRKSLKSLQNTLKDTKLNIYIIIVIDGDIPKKHKKLLNEFSFNCYFKKNNGGVARAKNTSIRLLLEQNIDIGFLADDDVLYKKNFLEKYLETILKGKIHHIGYVQMHPIVHPKNEWSKFGYVKTKINNAEIMKHGGGGVGCWLSFTPELIKKIGYFKVMEGKYGFEHINFTHRCIHNKIIPHACDIIDALDYMDHIGFEPVGYNQYNKNHSIEESLRTSENDKNRHIWRKNLDEYVPLIE